MKISNIRKKAINWLIIYTFNSVYEKKDIFQSFIYMYITAMDNCGTLFQMRFFFLD